MAATTLGERIRMRVEALGLKQADLARAARVSRPTVHAWWHDEVLELKHKHLESVAKLLEVSPKWLSEGVGPMSPGLTTPSVIDIRAAEGDGPYDVTATDPVLAEAVRLLLTLGKPDRLEALQWLRGFCAGRKRERGAGNNTPVCA